MPLTHSLQIGGLYLSSINVTFQENTTFSLPDNLRVPKLPEFLFNTTTVEEELAESRRIQQEARNRFTNIRNQLRTKLRDFIKNPVKEGKGIIAGIGGFFANVFKGIYNGLSSIFGSVWSSVIGIIVFFVVYSYVNSQSQRNVDHYVYQGYPLPTINRHTSGATNV